MNDHFDITAQRQERLIADLKSLAAWRAGEEAEIAKRHAARDAEARRDHQRKQTAAAAKFQAAHARLIAEYHERREAVLCRYEAQGLVLAQEEDRLLAVHDQRHGESLDAAKTLRQHRVAGIQREFREQKLIPRADLAKFQEHCEESSQELTALTVRTQAAVRRRAAWPEEAAPPPEAPAGLSRPQAVEQFSAALADAYARSQELTGVASARFLDEGWPVLIFLALLAAFGYPAYRLVAVYGLLLVAIGTVLAALAITGIAFAIVVPLARRALLRRVPPFQEAAARARVYLAAALAAARIEAARRHRRIVEHASRELAAAKAESKQSRRELKALRATRITQTHAEYAGRRRIVEETHERELDQIEDKHPRRIEALEQDFTRELEAIDDQLRRAFAASRRQREGEVEQVQSRWRAGLEDFRAAAQAMNEYCQAVAPPWDQVAERLAGGQSAARLETVTALPIGRLRIELPTLSGEAPAPPLPAALVYPDQPSLLIKAADAGR
ncbi:MAG TPA: hypothetical protein VFV87_05180, partial [Pirellulaceae bacterium]|nr:hypothetical protein [Pirellulaceae bacterium]